MAYQTDPNEIGALWVKSGRKGEYMTGTVGGQRVVCFATGKSGKAPQWRVLKSQPREDEAPDIRRPGDDEAPW